MFQGPGVHVVAFVPVATHAAAEQRRYARGQGRPDELRANKMNVRIDSARGDNFPFAGDHFRAGADHHAGRHTVH